MISKGCMKKCLKKSNVWNKVPLYEEIDAIMDIKSNSGSSSENSHMMIDHDNVDEDEIAKKYPIIHLPLDTKLYGICEIFDLFFTDSVLGEIVELTNQSYMTKIFDLTKFK